MKNSIALLLSLVCLLGVGCGERNRAADTGPGVVGQQTGDDDSQVDPRLQLLVAAALQRGDADQPLEGF